MLKITAVTPRSSAAMRCIRRHKLAPQPCDNRKDNDLHTAGPRIVRRLLNEQ
jgi:hypothetical protein